MHLSAEVLRFIARVRKSPAAAVDDTELERLEEVARSDMLSATIANSAPVAPLTWDSRATLLASQEEAPPDEIALGEPVMIVGFFPQFIALEPDPAVPPPGLEAFDVEVSFGRGKRHITNLGAKVRTSRDSSYAASLAALSSTIANRLIMLRLDEADPNVTFVYRWAVDSATRTALAWSNVLIKTSMFALPLERR